MTKSTRKDEINSQGLAKGWHADMLEHAAKYQGETMAQAFNRKIECDKPIAFSVPAECIQVTRDWIYYRFKDGSEARFFNQSGKV
jgi:hypothetical protein